MEGAMVAGRRQIHGVKARRLPASVLPEAFSQQSLASHWSMRKLAALPISLCVKRSPRAHFMYVSERRGLLRDTPGPNCRSHGMIEWHTCVELGA